jgi:hypothetical protein
MSKQTKPNNAGHSHENPILCWVRTQFRELGYSILGAVKKGHAAAFKDETGELILVDQLNADKKGDFDKVEVWRGNENLGLFTFKQIEAIMTGAMTKTGRPDWRMFDKGYYQALKIVHKDMSGFIQTLRENSDDESIVKALVAKYGIPEVEAKKTLDLTLANLETLSDEYIEERLK